MKLLKAIVVDDEWLVRSELKTLLAEFPSVEVVAEASNVPQAVESIRLHRPDVIFLDVQMPGETGFDLLDRVDVRAKIVFITAFDQYAIRAFEVNAVDCLLKPINRARLRQTLQRLGSEVPPEGKQGKTLQEWEDILPDKVFVRIHRSTIVNFEYVVKVKRCRNYTQLVYLREVEEPFIMSRRYALKLKQRMPW
jgi:two-component system LytT family response regulator